MATKDDAGDEPLKRLGGGRWQTRDERFTIEPQSGTWAVVDAEATDDFGLPLVRGPFPSLTAAKAAIATARSSEPATSPLAGRTTKGRDDERPAKPAARARATTKTKDERPAPHAGPAADRKAATRRAPEAAAEPGWIGDLAAAERGRARRLIATLIEAGIADAEGIVRRDLAGGVPALAAVAVARRLDALGAGAAPREVAIALADGRDDELGVRWRLVDGDGRPILVEAPQRGR